MAGGWTLQVETRSHFNSCFHSSPRGMTEKRLRSFPVNHLACRVYPLVKGAKHFAFGKTAVGSP